MSYYQAVAYYAAKAAPVKPEAKPTKRKRARYPAGHPQAGHFIADDPATPENEAWVEV